MSVAGCRIGFRGLQVLVAWLALASAPVALAQATLESNVQSEPVSDRPQVLLEVSNDTRDLLPLLRAELEDLNLKVIERPRESGINASSASAFRGTQAMPFRVVVTKKSVEVWIFDPTSNRVTLREVFNKVDGSALEARTTVLHAAELLRWSLNEYEPGTSRTSRRRASMAHEPTPVRQPTVWELGLSPMLAHSPGGSAPGAGLALDVNWKYNRTGLRLLGASLFVPHRVTLAEGRMEVTPSWLGLEGVLYSAAPGSKLGFSAGVGLSALRIHLHGISALALETHDDRFFTLAPLLDLRAHNELSHKLFLDVIATAMAPLRSDVMRIDDREVGRYGKVVVTVGVGLGLEL